MSGDRYRLIEPEGAEYFDDAWLAGMQVGPVVTEVPRRSTVLGVRLRPAGAYAVLGLPMREVCGYVAVLADLIGGAARELTDRCRAAADIEARFRIAAAWVAERVSRARGVLPEVAWSAAQIERSGGSVPIARLRSETGWSKTRLVSAFRDQIGVAPKLYARIVRFSRAAGPARGGRLADRRRARGGLLRSAAHERRVPRAERPDAARVPGRRAHGRSARRRRLRLTAVRGRRQHVAPRTASTRATAGPDFCPRPGGARSLS